MTKVYQVGIEIIVGHQVKNKLTKPMKFKIDISPTGQVSVIPIFILASLVINNDWIDRTDDPDVQKFKLVYIELTTGLEVINNNIDSKKLLDS